LHLRTFDAEQHIFLASHYLNNWFSPWEKRAYAGFYIYSYPPLVHQLVALLGFIAGLEAAYAVIQLLVVLALPIATYLFTREMVDKEAAGYAAVAMAVLPGNYLFLYTFGQLPNVTGVVLSLAAVAFLLMYLRAGTWTSLVAGTALGASAVLATTTTFLLFPLLLGTVFLECLRGAGKERVDILRRGAVAGAILTVAVGILLAPFLWWYLFEAKPISPIPHPTRSNIFADPISSRIYFWHIYGGFLPVIPFVLLRDVIVSRTVRVPVLYGAILMIVGLGFTTAIPRWIFGSIAHVLVYERFAYWAAVMSAMHAGVCFRELKLCARRWLAYFAIPFLVVSVAWSSLAAAWNVRNNWLFDRLQDWEEREIARFLNEAEKAKYAYLVLGLGENESVRLMRKVLAPSLDGFYAVARRPRELRESGIGMLSTARHFPNGLKMVETILKDPAKWSLRWVIVAEGDYFPLLERFGWLPDFAVGPNLKFDRDKPYLASVWIWRAPDRAAIPPLERNEGLWKHREPPAELAWIWGLGPLSALLFGALAAVFAWTSGGRLGR
jgi:hypothetical protein